LITVVKVLSTGVAILLVMTIREFMRLAKRQLAETPTPRLDALVLLEDITGKDRAWLLAHTEFELERNILRTLKKQLARRAAYEPLAYIRGKSEFYGRTFKVTPATLQPRPETETMIDLLKQIEGIGQRAKGKVFVDIGTGSGCLAITAKLEWPDAEVYATEINKDALKVARFNAKSHKTDVKFFHGNLLDPISAISPLPSALFAILANLPYVPNNHTVNEAAMQEPRDAIFGGPDGLDVYRQLFDQVQGKVIKPRYILTESLPFQHKTLASIAKAAGYKLKATDDFIQLFT
jgi:release factor glutamine methyltransferase